MLMNNSLSELDNPHTC